MLDESRSIVRGSEMHPEANTVTAALDRFGLWAVLGETRRMFLPLAMRNR